MDMSSNMKRDKEKVEFHNSNASCSYQTESQQKDTDNEKPLDPEVKQKLIRHVQQYLEKDLDKFLTGQNSTRR